MMINTGYLLPTATVISICHCSGERARQSFKDEYVDDYISNGVGGEIKI